PLWQDPARARFQLRLLRTIRDGGFSTVRINLHAFRHMDEASRLNPQWFATLDSIVGAALMQNLTVILDEHDYGGCAQDATACKAKLMVFWEQVGAHYRNAPDKVVFEILNEPNGALNDVWNDMLVDLLATVRRTNPTRNVVVGPAFWN